MKRTNDTATLKQRLHNAIAVNNYTSIKWNNDKTACIAEHIDTNCYLKRTTYAYVSKSKKRIVFVDWIKEQ